MTINADYIASQALTSIVQVREDGNTCQFDLALPMQATEYDDQLVMATMTKMLEQAGFDVTNAALPEDNLYFNPPSAKSSSLPGQCIITTTANRYLHESLAKHKGQTIQSYIAEKIPVISVQITVPAMEAAHLKAYCQKLQTPPTTPPELSAP